MKQTKLFNRFVTCYHRASRKIWKRIQSRARAEIEMADV